MVVYKKLNLLSLILIILSVEKTIWSASGPEPSPPDETALVASETIDLSPFFKTVGFNLSSEYLAECYGRSSFEWVDYGYPDRYGCRLYMCGFCEANTRTCRAMQPFYEEDYGKCHIEKCRGVTECLLSTAYLHCRVALNMWKQKESSYRTLQNEVYEWRCYTQGSCPTNRA